MAAVSWRLTWASTRVSGPNRDSNAGLAPSITESPMATTLGVGGAVVVVALDEAAATGGRRARPSADPFQAPTSTRPTATVDRLTASTALPPSGTAEAETVAPLRTGRCRWSVHGVGSGDVIGNRFGRGEGSATAIVQCPLCWRGLPIR